MKKIKQLIPICLIFVFLMGCTSNGHIISTGAESSVPQIRSEVKVPILMFHDVKTYEGGTWSISADNFRNTLCFLLDNGYTPISFQHLVDYCDGKSDIPEKPVCITLDDGYFSNYRNVLPIAQELKIPITIFMICSDIRSNGITPPTNEEILTKLSIAELNIINSSAFATVQSHTFSLHGINISDNDERSFALPLKNESKKAFQLLAQKDCELAENVLKEAGTEKVFVFSYPGGKVHSWFDEVIRKRGYRVSVTSDEHKINLVTRGEPDSLFLLGRFNVNDSTTEKELLEYLNK